MNSFTQLANDVRDRLYRLALRVVGEAEEAEDVVQEVLTVGWQRRSEIVGLDNPPAWLLRMARNRAIDRLRARQSRHANEAGAAARDHDDRTPLRAVEARDTLDHVHRLMRQLPETQRSVLHLREVEGMTYDEIAEVTGLSLASVKVNIHRGRQRLRELFISAKLSP